VKFMGETSKILSPEKTVLMPTLEATCSLDLILAVNPSPFPAIYVILKKLWYQSGTKNF